MVWLSSSGLWLLPPFYPNFSDGAWPWEGLWYRCPSVLFRASAGTYSETCCRNFVFDFLAIGKERLAPKGGVFQIEGQAGGSRYTLLGIGELAWRHGGTWAHIGYNWRCISWFQSSSSFSLSCECNTLILIVSVNKLYETPIWLLLLETFDQLWIFVQATINGPKTFDKVWEVYQSMHEEAGINSEGILMPCPLSIKIIVNLPLGLVSSPTMGWFLVLGMRFFLWNRP